MASFRKNNKNTNASCKNNVPLQKTSENNVPLQKTSENNNSTLRNYENAGSGFLNNIFQGFALGIGSQLATRSIDTIFGNRKIEIETNNCLKESQTYLNCLENNDKNNCIEFFNQLENCKKS
jgi:hypothetical protein